MTASRDPIYLVSDGGAALTARPPADDRRRSAARPTAAARIVLSQRFPTGAAYGPTPPGYRLGASARARLDVYNFNRTPQRVTVAGRAWGGWSVRLAGPRTLRVPAMGRVSLPVSLAAGARVRPGVSYPLVFSGTVGGRAVSPSVSRIVRPGARRGRPIPLAPSIARMTPANGATVPGPEMRLTARIADGLSGVDRRRVAVEVDGRPVAHRFDTRGGRLSATLRLTPGRHRIAIRAYNNAGAPALASADLMVGGAATETWAGSR